MKTLYLFPVVLLLAASCKEEPLDTLPKATQEGKNTMGCLVDGKAWTPSKPKVSSPGGGGDPWAIRWRAAPAGYGMTISFFSATGRAEVPTSIQFFVPDVRFATTVPLNQAADPAITSSNPAYAICSLGNKVPSRKFLTGPDAVGELVLTRFDTVAHIVSGTFHFTGREAGTGQTMQVTDGRFDMRLP